MKTEQTEANMITARITARVESYEAWRERAIKTGLVKGHGAIEDELCICWNSDDNKTCYACLNTRKSYFGVYVSNIATECRRYGVIPYSRLK